MNKKWVVVSEQQYFVTYLGILDLFFRGGHYVEDISATFHMVKRYEH